MKKILLVAVLAFAITLAVLIGKRMSTDAMAVVIGVAVGVAASVPMSLLLVALLRRERMGWRQEQSPPSTALSAQPPNIIVLNPADLLGQRPGQPYQPLPPPDLQADAGLRRLRVVGAEEEWSARDW